MVPSRDNVINHWGITFICSALGLSWKGGVLKWKITAIGVLLQIQFLKSIGFRRAAWQHSQEA